MIVFRSRTLHSQSPPLTIGRTVMKESYDLVILGVTFDSKMNFGKHAFFARFPEQLLKDLVSRGSPGDCSMIYIASWEMRSEFCPARFGVLFCSLVLGCRYTP